MRDPIREFQKYNRPFVLRHPELIRTKIDRMADSPFGFFRGSFHLFARDWIEGSLPAVAEGGDSPHISDMVGDVHNENYGTFKGWDDALHYDLNDFDETTQGPLALDLCRLATSTLLLALDRGDSLERAVPSVMSCSAAYTQTLLATPGDPAAPDRDDLAEHCAATDELLAVARAAKRPAFIQKLTDELKGGRRLKRSPRYFELPTEERALAMRLLEDYRKRMPPAPNDHFYDVQDICGRIAGNGSMGRLRYAVLVNGKGNTEARNVLLEFKEAYPSGYDLCLGRRPDEEALCRRAEQVITMQRRSQRASNRHLGYALNGSQSFQVREIGPYEQRVDHRALKSTTRFEELAAVQGRILARIHRAALFRASAGSKPLAGMDGAYQQRVLAFALAYADIVRKDWEEFVKRRAELESWRG
jgi:uncharacterized protein (DUF2252 family)